MAFKYWRFKSLPERSPKVISGNRKIIKANIGAKLKIVTKQKIIKLWPHNLSEPIKQSLFPLSRRRKRPVSFPRKNRPDFSFASNCGQNQKCQLKHHKKSLVGKHRDNKSGQKYLLSSSSSYFPFFAGTFLSLFAKKSYISETILLGRSALSKNFPNAKRKLHFYNSFFHDPSADSKPWKQSKALDWFIIVGRIQSIPL